MNSKLSLLSVVLLVQLLIIASMWLLPAQEEDAVQQLLALRTGDVDRLVIADSSNEVILEKQPDDTWQVSNVPAASTQVENILEKLANLDAPWPVATSSASAERFEVSDTRYQRLVKLYSGEERQAELYLGTSPSYQRVHARRGDDSRVYSVALSNFELSASPDNWIDKSVFAMEQTPEQIDVVFVDTDSPIVQLRKTEEGWVYNEEAADADATQTYANRFTTLRVLGLAEKAETLKDLARIELLHGGNSRTFTLSQVVGEADEYRLSEKNNQADDQTYYRLATYVAEQILMTDADFSLKDDETSTEESVSEVGEG